MLDARIMFPYCKGWGYGKKKSSTGKCHAKKVMQSETPSKKKHANSYSDD